MYFVILFLLALFGASSQSPFLNKILYGVLKIDTFIIFFVIDSCGSDIILTNPYNHILLVDNGTLPQPL